MHISVRLFHITLLIFSLMFTSLVNARIVRSGGVATSTDSFDYTVEMAYTSGINTIGLDGGYYGNSFSYNSFADYVYATPALDCHYNIQYNNEDNIARRTDCDYEFDLGDRLQLQGYLEVFLEKSASYDLFWTITQGTKQWQFSGPEVWLTDGSRDVTKNVFLDVAMPLDMLVGDYEVRLDFIQYAPTDVIYYGYNSLIDPYHCEDIQTGPNTIENVCGQIGTASDTLGFTSKVENMRILGAQVPEPVSFALFMLGLVTLRRLNSIRTN
ncbi:hypothetical protein [Neptunicella marina]|uniref:Uncharacterized protein n=1 Tax=Neptunicella marina TaxID=2125989 RepID=A0A8J6ISV5_9ALTE|nr:hypothetical protein [Neptunicella marina]MBC3765180.1 hypothetical protein [Neptunicella marina]